MKALEKLKAASTAAKTYQRENLSRSRSKIARFLGLPLVEVPAGALGKGGRKGAKYYRALWEIVDAATLEALTVLALENETYTSNELTEKLEAEYSANFKQ